MPHGAAALPCASPKSVIPMRKSPKANEGLCHHNPSADSRPQNGKPLWQGKVWGLVLVCRSQLHQAIMMFTDSRLILPCHANTPVLWIVQSQRRQIIMETLAEPKVTKPCRREPGEGPGDILQGQHDGLHRLGT
jgi:hypothetical protein